MTLKFNRIFILVMVLHFIMLIVPIAKKIKVNLNIQEVPVIKVNLIEDLHREQVFVESESEGIKEEVDTKFIADKTQKVEKETVSTQMPRKGKEASKDLSFNDLQPTFNGEEIPAPNRKPPVKESGGAEYGAINGSRYQMFDEEISEGDKTSLNTIEFKYASFYKRINEQVRNSWIPMVTNISSLAPGTYRTRIILKINKEGEIIGMKLDSASGVELLDDIAHEAFIKVRIFPNPPSDLFNGKEYLYIPWTLELRN